MDFEHMIIYFLVPKREGAIIKRSAIFGGNMLHKQTNISKLLL